MSEGWDEKCPRCGEEMTQSDTEYRVYYCFNCGLMVQKHYEEGK